ncbi:MAG: LacI family DNA-binding transcriptional regulator [Lachnospiraceae bacterium]|nr:LacI family DNA-binding transcriptional regulator [Lachnospiraceae bacterium]
MSRVTLKMIAEKSGVSIGTVDRAINNRGRINASTKQEIIDIANSLGYQPNHLASALSRRQHLRIAVIMPRFPHYFMDELLAGAESIKNELADYNVELEYIFSNTLSSIEQEALLCDLDLNRYNAIAINAGSDSLIPYINRFIENEIPVVTFNSDVPKSMRLFYVGEDSYSSGRVAGELLGKILNGNGNVVLLVGFNNISSHHERAKGFQDYLRSYYPNINIINVYEYHDKEEEAFQIMQQLLDSDINISGVFCVSAVGVVGVGNCLVNNKKPNEVHVIGYDINYQSAQLLQAGYCDALLYQDPRKQSRRALLSLFNLLTGKWESTESCYFTKTKIVLKSNLNDYIEDIYEKKICD